MAKLNFKRPKRVDNASKRNKLLLLALMLVVTFGVVDNWDKIFNKEETAKEESVLVESAEELKKKNEQADSSASKQAVAKGKERYGVSSSNDLASAVALKVLEDGGNAADAAIALSFALNVTDPQNSGIGGGGGMMISDTAKAKEVFYDYYISSGDTEQAGEIGIPGFLKGMDQINKDMGSMPLAKILDYVIAFAEKGVRVTADYADILSRYNYIAQVYPDVLRPDGQLLQEGDTFIQHDLIETLKLIQKEGVGFLYNGEHEISKNFINFTGISAEALANYKVNVSEPLKADYKGYKVLAPKGPFSGLTIIQNLLLEEQLNLPAHSIKDANYIDKMQELLMFTGHEGRIHISDPAFKTEDFATLVDKDQLKKRYDEFAGEEGFYDEPETESTTAFSVIDKNGMIVSGTNTISNYWGSYFVDHGIIYNNAMKNFSAGTNKFEQNKRPKTGIAPVIVTNEEGFKEAFGANGGSKIPTYMTEYLISTKKNSMSPQDANDLERLYYLKGLMTIESSAPIKTFETKADIKFSQPFTTQRSSHAWGLMNGIVFTEDGTVFGHNDKRNYFDGGSLFIVDGKKYPEAQTGTEGEQQAPAAKMNNKK